MAWRLADPLSFLIAEGRGRGPATGVYRLRHGGTVEVRHRTRDTDILREVFGPRPIYRPPAAIGTLLRGPIRVLDLGGNVGLFGVYALTEWEVASLVSLEPDPENQTILQRVVAHNDAEDRWRVLAAAAANSSEPIRFIGGMFSESRRAESGEPGVVVPAHDVFAHPPVDLLKLDIEGGEWALLDDPRLPQLPARVLVMEWHWRFSGRGDPRTRAVGRLQRAGYTVLTPPATGEPSGLLWAYRPGPSGRSPTG